MLNHYLVVKISAVGLNEFMLYSAEPFEYGVNDTYQHHVRYVLLILGRYWVCFIFSIRLSILLS